MPYASRSLAVALIALSACAPALPPPALPPIVAAQPAPPPPVVVEAPPPAPPPPPLADLELATHRSFFDAMRAHDPGALAALYAPDAAVDMGPGIASADGPEALTTLAKTLWMAFPDAKEQWSVLVEAGDTIAVELAWTGTHTGALGEMAPTKKVVGTALLLVERFAPSGLVVAQRLYVDTDALTSDLRTRAGRPRAFAGLPTSQITVRDHAAATGGDDAVIQSLVASFSRGAFKDALPLAVTNTTWTDETKGHTTTGKAALSAWVSSLARAFHGVEKPSVNALASGDWLVLEWGASSDGAASRAADVVRFEGGKVAEVRSYRGSAPKPDVAHRHAPGSPTNQ